MAVTYPTLTGSDLQTAAAPGQPFAGQAPIVSSSAVAAADIEKWEVCAILAAGTITPYVDATHNRHQMVVAAIGVASGKVCNYWPAGSFNHAALVWPAEYDTYAKRKGLCVGSMIHVSSLLPADL